MSRRTKKRRAKPGKASSTETLRASAATQERVKSTYREQYHNRLQAKYDAAHTTAENEAHWAMTDSLSADSALDPATRKRLRERSRYEASNSSFYDGALKADADAAIGPGPNLRFFFGDDAVDSQARELFKRHSRRIHLAHKLRQMRIAMRRDGEAVAARITNFQLPPDGPRADLRLVECDRLAAPYDFVNEEDNIDGVIVDSNGVPESYQILDRHPGDTHPWVQGDFGRFRRFAAADLIHYFHATRPEQHRGLPVVTPCLNLFAQYRRFKLAVLTAAETAANVAAMLKMDTSIVSELAAGNGGGLIIEPDELFEIVRGSIPALPPGYSLDQMKAEQPTTTLDMFERTLLREIARAFGMPRIVLSGDAGDANQSAGNIDYRFWWQHLESERSHFDEVVIDKWAGWWWANQRLIPSDRGQGSLPLAARQIDYPRRRTTWSTRFEHNDPYKVAQATRVYHELGLQTDDRWAEEQNLDPAEHNAELERQVARREKLGINIVGGGPIKEQTPAPEENGFDGQDN